MEVFFSFLEIHKIIVYHIIDGNSDSMKCEIMYLRTRGKKSLFIPVFTKYLLDARPLPDVGDTM